MAFFGDRIRLKYATVRNDKSIQLCFFYWENLIDRFSSVIRFNLETLIFSIFHSYFDKKTKNRQSSGIRLIKKQLNNCSI